MEPSMYLRANVLERDYNKHNNYQMKKIFKFLLVSILFASCSDDSGTNKNTEDAANLPQRIRVENSSSSASIVNHTFDYDGLKIKTWDREFMSGTSSYVEKSRHEFVYTNNLITQINHYSGSNLVPLTLMDEYNVYHYNSDSKLIKEERKSRSTGEVIFTVLYSHETENNNDVIKISRPDSPGMQKLTYLSDSNMKYEGIDAGNFVAFTANWTFDTEEINPLSKITGIQNLYIVNYDNGTDPTFYKYNTVSTNSITPGANPASVQYDYEYIDGRINTIIVDDSRFTLPFVQTYYYD
ncbi:hypothetical protein OGH69_09765 [Flavobacterium sp. MFBS3-15]|uniref:hypothetical protein n=1 Tax=Flavobacterium sp. MFBS3-15 TaxID=2989816 RepID=UPI00223582B2|nr:hypothetical protein [Flavobacterium sp. MFBS3-15]MCW4469252.1 hypothetical protein [Flavobacterium sp. MFBS3-15]